MDGRIGAVGGGRDWNAAGEEDKATGARRARGGVVYKRGERDKIRANKKAIRDRTLRVCDGSEDGRTLARVSSAPRACIAASAQTRIRRARPRSATFASSYRDLDLPQLRSPSRHARAIPSQPNSVAPSPRPLQPPRGHRCLPVLLHSSFPADMSRLPPPFQDADPSPRT